MIKFGLIQLSNNSLCGLINCASNEPNIALDVPVNNIQLSKQLSDSTLWILNYDTSKRNPIWAFEVLNRKDSFARESDRKKSKFFSEPSLIDSFKVGTDPFISIFEHLILFASNNRFVQMITKTVISIGLLIIHD
jgi:hypothetical protein